MGFHPTWFCPLKTGRWGEGVYLTDKIYYAWQKLFVDDFLIKEKIAQALFEILKSDTNKNFKVLLGQITSTMNIFVVVAVYVFFQFYNDLAIII